MMLVDFYTDKNGEVLKKYLISNKVELPKLEKTASFNIDTFPKEELNSEAFADPINKMFPIFTKEAAQISALYVKAQSDEVPYEVKKRVQEACDLFDLDEDVIGFKKVAFFTPKLEDSDFIFPEKRKLPVVDKETWELSKDVFMKIANELAFDDVVIGSRRLIKKARELNMDYDESLSKLAFENVYINKEELVKIAQDRFIQTADDRYLELSKAASIVPSEEAHFVLRELIEVDRSNYIDSTADLMQKIATHKKDDIINLSGLEIPVDKIAEIPEDEWKEILPYEEIDYFTDENGFNKEAFVKMYNALSPIEQDIIESFIQKKL